MRLGFVGAGRMGRPMVCRLIEAGHEMLMRLVGHLAGVVRSNRNKSGPRPA